MSPQEALQMIPAQYLYDDENQLIDEFCSRFGCNACSGTMHESYESNGYGCDANDQWVNKWYGLIRENPKR